MGCNTFTGWTRYIAMGSGKFGISPIEKMSTPNKNMYIPISLTQYKRIRVSSKLLKQLKKNTNKKRRQYLLYLNKKELESF